jgi:uncharacterized protein (TIGR03437 family)
MICHTPTNLFRTPLAKLAALLVLGAGILGAQALTLVSGNGQVTASNFKTNVPMVVQATGSNGQPASGVTVTWAVTTGPGYTQDQSTTTDVNGLTNTFFTGIAPDSVNSYYPSTVTATAGSSTVSFIMTTVHSPTTSVSARVITPVFGATLTAQSGTTISDALQVQVFVNDGIQSGSGIPNVGLAVQSYPDPTVAPAATCNAPSGIALSDSTGTATCNLNVTGAAGSSQLLGLIGGTFLENPIFNLQITPGTPCSYSLSASSQSFTSVAGTGSVNVITTSACAWTAVSNANFITITSGASGTGNGTVSYSVAANNSVARTGTLTVAGKTYTVNQSAASSPSSISITTANLPPSNVGASYSATLTATGGQQPYTWSISGSLPSGLSLTPSTGVISGVPASSGSYGFTATVVDTANNTASANLSITIDGTSSGGFAITNVSFANGAVGQPYSQPLTTVNFCITPFSANVNFAIISGSLPNGLTIGNNPDSSHSITGTPQSNGAFPFTLKATDTCGNVATMSYTILIGAVTQTQQMTVSPPSLLFMAQIGAAAPAPQAFTISANAGTLSYSVTVSTKSGGSWLVAQSASTGTTPASFTVGVTNYASLAPGPYSGSITINSTASNSPVVVPVTLTVVPATSIVLQSQAAFFLSQLASSSLGSTLATQEQISITSGGASPVNFTASASTTDGNRWLTVSPTSGATPATLTATVDTGGLPVGKYTGTVVIAAGSGMPVTISFTVTVTEDTPVVTSVVNGASFLSGSVAPGEIVTIFGTAIGPQNAATLQLDQSGKVATTLVGTQVFFDENPAPLIYSSTGQVSAIVPYEIAGQTTTSVSVQYLNLRSSGVSVPVAATSPAIFTINGTPQGAILNQDSTVNSASNGAVPGSIVSIYATGEGQTSPPGIDGVITQTTLPMPLLPVTVQIAGQNAQVQYAGAAPGEPAGVLQVNVTIPSSVPRGVSVPVVIMVGNTASQTGVMVAIAP